MHRQLTCALAALLLLTPSAFAADACRAAASFPNKYLLADMVRGVNLAGWDADSVSTRPARAQLEALRERGFTHIRLPIDNRRIEGPGSAEYLDRVDTMIVFLFVLGFSISVDLHADETVGALFERDPSEAETYLQRIWRKISRQVHRHDTAKLAIELLNEPQTTPEIWNKSATRLIAEIRRFLPRHTIIVGPAGPQRHETLAGMQPFDDDNIVYAIHYYDPFAFTHQGADWSSEALGALKDLSFPARLSDQAIQAKIAALKASGQSEAASVLERSLETPWDQASIASAFDMMGDWSERTGQPVIVNEFGVLSYHAPRQARLNWLATVREEAERHCIGWTHWDFQDGFGLMDPATGMPDAGIMQALVPARD